MSRDYGGLLRKAETRRQLAQVERAEAAAAMRALVREARDAGMSVQDIADQSGVERTNVYWLLKGR